MILSTITASSGDGNNLVMTMVYQFTSTLYGWLHGSCAGTSMNVGRRARSYCVRSQVHGRLQMCMVL